VDSKSKIPITNFVNTNQQTQNWKHHRTRTHVYASERAHTHTHTQEGDLLFRPLTLTHESRLKTGIVPIIGHDQKYLAVKYISTNQTASTKFLNENMYSTTTKKKRVYTNVSRPNLYAAVHLLWQNSWNGTRFVRDALKMKLQPAYFAYWIP